MMVRALRLALTGLLLAAVTSLASCAVIPQNPKYPGPAERPMELELYYGYSEAVPYQSFSEQIVTEKRNYVHKRIFITTSYGQITVELYERRKSNDNLILVFPILGGKHLVEGYFAKYIADHGMDAAIVHRDQDFKRPEMFDSIEQILRGNVIRDRIALDFFEREHAKKNFGSFGISRGAINAAVTAGVDPRLKVNVLALGGSHIVDVFKKTDVGGVLKYRSKVKAAKNITDEEFFAILNAGIKTDPKNLAGYIDASHTLMFLSAFDNAVPIRYGMKLRREIGRPKTIFLAAGHYTALLYTQFIKLLPPSDTFCIFPLDFIESEAMRFYFEQFEIPHADLFHVPLMIFQLPIQIVGKLYWELF